MIHIYTYTHCTHCLSLNYTFPQIVYINHVKEGDVAHCASLWTLTHWRWNLMELCDFYTIFAENLDVILGKHGLSSVDKGSVDSGVQSLRILCVFKQC